MICAKISLEAGGGWLGHTFFLVEHPILKNKTLSTNSINQVEKFCKSNNLFFDKEELLDILSKLKFDSKLGWIVPHEKLNKNLPISSANKYLKEIQKNYF